MTYVGRRFAVIGPGRGLPQFRDRRSLPYSEAVPDLSYGLVTGHLSGGCGEAFRGPAETHLAVDGDCLPACQSHVPTGRREAGVGVGVGVGAQGPRTEVASATAGTAGGDSNALHS